MKSKKIQIFYSPNIQFLNQFVLHVNAGIGTFTLMLLSCFYFDTMRLVYQSPRILQVWEQRNYVEPNGLNRQCIQPIYGEHSTQSLFILAITGNGIHQHTLQNKRYS